MAELSFQELRESCGREVVTCLCCEQGWEDTMEDVVTDNPDMPASELKVVVMSRMLEENLDYGPITETDDELDSDNHEALLGARYDVCDEVARRWVAGDYRGKHGGHPLMAAREDSLALSQAKAEELGL